ncbi:unnamed protein product [Ectocarpus sp. CCAP 1310/34]|nr:unnamed protein product [Ectocarpus sp. CCAP 1310/34]
MRCAERVALSCGVILCALVDPGGSFVAGGQRPAVAGRGRQWEKRPRCDGVLVQSSSSSSSSSSLETSTTSDEYEHQAAPLSFGIRESEQSDVLAASYCC